MYYYRLSINKYIRLKQYPLQMHPQYSFTLTKFYFLFWNLAGDKTRKVARKDTHEHISRLIWDPPDPNLLAAAISTPFWTP